jgi:hypothetical protein
MLTVLFWNFNCKLPDPETILADVVAGLCVDLLALTESTTDPDRLLEALRHTDPNFDQAHVDHPRFQLFTRFEGARLTGFAEDDRLSVSRLRLAGRKEILFGVLHLFDRRNYDRDAQHTLGLSVYNTLYAAEEAAGHVRTIVVGDFNMNPFEKGILDGNGFGAMATRSLAARHTRDGKNQVRRFYNPTWTRLGRDLPEAPGTYYWDNSADPFNLFWHSLDQVLVRPALFNSFRDEDFQILTAIPWGSGETLDLIRDRGKHWELRVSDHLPVLFKLEPPLEDHHG